jgi:hypothetical protein
MGFLDWLSGTVKCPVCESYNVECVKNCCGSSGLGLLGKGKGKVKGKPVTATYKCNDCGIRFTRTEICPEEIEGEVGGGCYITTATFIALNICDDNCYELKKFRWYRDNILSKEPDGPELIKEYYKTAPLIVKRIEETSNRDEIYKQIWANYLKPCLEYLEKKEFNKVKDIYVSMVRNLQRRFLKGKNT